MSFIEKLDKKSLEVFNEAAHQPFSAQCVFFLNAFWQEYGDQAEYIYAIIWDTMKKTEMEAQGIQYVHKYEEGINLDFDMGLYFFEQMCKFYKEPGHSNFTQRADWVKEHKNFQEDYKKSFPAMMTSISRKKELRDKVDVNFDGRVSMIEFLCYQYKASPKDLVERSMNTDEDEDIRKARLALVAVTKSITAYEAEKARLEEGTKAGGVKALKCKNELAQLASSPLWETLQRALITAEASVRIATRNAKKKGSSGGSGSSSGPSEGAIWWMNRDLEEKQKKYGKRK